jgi:phosphoglycolate phosphatase
MNAKTKFIVWDWNGTLLDDAEAVLFAENAILTAFNYAPVSMEKFRALNGRPFGAFYTAVGFSEEERKHAAKDRKMFHEYYEQHPASTTMRDGSVNILRRLKTHQVMNVIVSNHITDKIIRMLRQYDIHHHVDDVIAYACHNTQMKGSTKGEKLHHHLTATGLNPANAIIIGDTVEEIEIARELGMISVAITGGDYAESRLREKNPDYVIHSMHELNAILEERGFVA